MAANFRPIKLKYAWSRAEDARPLTNSISKCATDDSPRPVLVMS
mgnify:CR=1 FL=1